MMLRSLALCLLMLTSACASVQMATPAEDRLGKSFAPPPPDKGALYLYREGLMGALVPLDVVVQTPGGGLDVTLAPDTWVRLEGDPGPLEIRCAKDQNVGQRLDVRPGETRYVEVAYRMALWGTTCGVHEVSQQEGQAAVAKGRRAVAGSGAR